MKGRIKKKHKRKEFIECCAEPEWYGGKPGRTKWLNGVTMAWHRYMKARAWNLPKEGT